MQTTQVIVESALRPEHLDVLARIDPQLVLVFGAADRLDDNLHRTLRAALPQARLAGCSTAGEISDQGLSDRSVVLTAVRCADAAFAVASGHVDNMADSEAAGARLAAALGASGADCRHVFVLAPGVDINGSALIRGLRGGLPDGARLSGGLAADDGSFRDTRVIDCQGVHRRGLVGIALPDDGGVIGHGSYGGWQPFGPVRKVTRSRDNLLFELDGERALDIYRRYLGDYAAQLPAAALLFPFAMRNAQGNAVGLVRTIVGLDDAGGALVLAGDVEPEGYMQLMHARAEALVDGAATAARRALGTAPAGPGLAILVSCMGRRLALGARAVEELDAAAAVLGPDMVRCGFYANGEIGPLEGSQECKLHNQTMTVTTLRCR